MSEVVDRWVRQLKGKLPPIGSMTHWERMAAAFDLQPMDMPAVAPELDYWQINVRRLLSPGDLQRRRKVH
jgi:hypothetical protein